MFGECGRWTGPAECGRPSRGVASVRNWWLPVVVLLLLMMAVETDCSCAPGKADIFTVVQQTGWTYIGVEGSCMQDCGGGSYWTNSLNTCAGSCPYGRHYRKSGLTPAQCEAEASSRSHIVMAYASDSNFRCYLWDNRTSFVLNKSCVDCPATARAVGAQHGCL
jgi:hypothetical protein